MLLFQTSLHSKGKVGDYESMVEGEERGSGGHVGYGEIT